MMLKKQFKIKTPSNIVVGAKKNKLELRWNKGMPTRVSNCLSKAQEFVDSEVLRRCDPLVPRLTGELIKSGTISTIIGNGEVNYNTPYARRQYYENSGEGQRGSRWFERMKASDKDAILKGAKEYIG